MEVSPVGLRPKWLWDIERLRDIQGAMSRYSDAGKEIPVEWIEEYNELIKATESRQKKEGQNA